MWHGTHLAVDVGKRGSWRLRDLPAAGWAGDRAVSRLDEVVDPLVRHAVWVDATAAAVDRADDRRTAAKALRGGLEAIAATRALLDSAELFEIAAARAQGCSWQEVATALGVTRQAAMMRWSHAVDQLERGQLDAMTDPLI